MLLIPDDLKRPDLRAAIIDAIQTAYEVNVERYDPDQGDDAVSFGILVWKSTTHFLRRRLAGLDGVSVTVVNQSADIRVGNCELRNHKLGNSEVDDPYRSFPGHPGPAARMGRVEQLELGLNLEAIRPLDWVIAHYGSPDEGLRAIRLQAPGADRDADGSIVSWRHVETIYDAASAATREVRLTSGTGAPAVPIADADISIKREAEAESPSGPE